ncbi:hypothetical protein LTR62_001685 [Meristemomyces frigidus]|uniref:RING-type E3 ubiquitin transferase n=1 Tax=Meristemomyces frigidus TaxID=1508187 RepID=A0AAN7T934_9PEZI|nr:hypothetical protein LTR62_001685 [Meristemomyces frigidus]
MDGDGSAHEHTQLVKSSEHSDESPTNTDAPTGSHSTTNTAKLDTCTICLQIISERAVAVPCNHLSFDFLCLVSWLQEQATCPLCKAAVTKVQYDWRAPKDYKTYQVPVKKTEKRTAVRAGHRPTERSGSRTGREGTIPSDPAVRFRQRVYQQRTYAKHIGSNHVSQYRDFTPLSFTKSPDLQSRARAFLRRELQVFSFLDGILERRGGTRDYLIEYIVAVLKSHEMKAANAHAEGLVAEFLGETNAKQLLHELEAWLRSPYERLEQWDRCVQYESDNHEIKG